MEAAIKVLVVEDEPGFQQTLCRWLIEADGIALAGVADSEAEGLVLARERSPDVILMSAALWSAAAPGDSLARRYQGCPVLMLSDLDQELEVLEALRNGAAGCLVREQISVQSLRDALYALQRGDAVLTPRLAGFILDRLNGVQPTHAEL